MLASIKSRLENLERRHRGDGGGKVIVVKAFGSSDEEVTELLAEHGIGRDDPDNLIVILNIAEDRYGIENPRKPEFLYAIPKRVRR